MLAEWRELGRITVGLGGTIVFPDMPGQPGLYRMTFTGAPAQARPRVYVGQSDNLRARAAGYRNAKNPSQTTNVRLKAAIQRHHAEGGLVLLAVSVRVKFEHPEASGLSQLDLSRKSNRLLAESAALVAAQLRGDVDIENLD